jgi:hypothetical protein
MNADMGILGTRSLCVFRAVCGSCKFGDVTLRQVYRIRESNQFSAVLTVYQTASLCEGMRKSLRRQKRRCAGS